MKKTNRFWLCLLLTLALAAAFGLTALAAEPDEIVADGCCGGTGDGTNLTWTLTGDGALTVSGEGPTGDYSHDEMASYAAFRGDIVSVTFTEGVTRVGDFALGEFEYLETLSLPRSLESAGELVLDGCVSLREIRYAGTYDELCAVSMPEQIGDLGEVELEAIIRYLPNDISPLEWSVEDGVLTFSGEGVIPDTAFYGNTPWFDLRDDITEVIVPEGITYIGAFAFAGLENLRVLRLPASLEGAGEGALAYCRNLEELYYNGTWEQLEALLQSGSIDDPCLPDEVIERLEGHVEDFLHVNYDDVFTGVDWYIEDSVMHISCNGDLPVYAVDGVALYKNTPWYDQQDSFHTIVVEEGVTGLGDMAFAGLTRLQELYLPSTLTQVGEKIVWNDEYLYAVYCAFDDAKAEQLDLFAHLGKTFDYEDTFRTEQFCPDQLICLGDNVRRFSYGDFTFIGGSVRTLVTGYTGTAAECVLPLHPVDENGNVIETYEIAPWGLKSVDWISEFINSEYTEEDGSIHYYTYLDLRTPNAVTSLTIPGSVRVIRPKAFQYMWKLLAVELPDGLTTIGDWAFARTKLKSVYLPDSVVNFGEYVFYGNNLSEGIRLPAGIETIPVGMFNWCSIVSFTAPDSVKTIGCNAFHNCRSLTELQLNDGLEVLGDHAFETTGLTSVVFPDSVTEIGAYCFQFCSKLEEIVWPRNLEKLGFSSFRYCKLLTSVVLPDTLRYMEGCVFDECLALTSVVLPEGVQFVTGRVIDDITGEIHNYPVQSMFRGCRSLKEITLPESVTDVGSGMFNVCPSLEKVVIKGNIDCVGPYMFKDCSSLKELFLPASVRYFGLSQYDLDHGFTQSYRYSRVFYSVDDSNGGYTQIDAPFTGDIYFAGTPEQWAAVYAPKDDLSGATVHFPETRTIEPTCTAHGCSNAVYYSDSDYVIDPGEFRSAYGHSPVTVAATEAIAEAHGYTDGVYCQRCHEWLSGHEVVHNTLGETTVLQKPTATQAGECLITCTVCGERGLYAMDPVTDDTDPDGPQPGEDDPAEAPEDNTPIGRIRRAMKSIIEFFLRLLQWLGVNKQN